ncbi:MAG: endonuclease domain-containing protein [Oscillospiraceae bacterium]|nr:endonuclease domain-containing protein [Oscillospiraceae bacterium]
MSLTYDDQLIGRAKALRKEMTPQEQRLWYEFLRKYPVRFQRQKVIDAYIVDFYCHKARLVVEIDGSQHYEPQEQDHDERRTNALEQHGLLVVRFSNREVNLQFREVCERIDQLVRERAGNDGCTE